VSRPAAAELLEQVPTSAPVDAWEETSSWVAKLISLVEC